jgi:hypothetical protein
MKLSVRERLMLLALLPREGSYTNLKLIRKTREALSFSEKENADLGFREEDREGSRVLAWNVSADVSKEIKIGETVANLIKSELSKLSDAGKLSDDHIPIYEKFFEEEGEEK